MNFILKDIILKNPQSFIFSSELALRSLLHPVHTLSQLYCVSSPALDSSDSSLSKESTSFFSTLKLYIQNEGFTRLYHDFLPRTLFFIGDTLLAKILFDGAIQYLGLSPALMSLVAPVLSYSFLYPLDLISTLLATQSTDRNENRPYEGFWDCILTLYRSKGIKGLYRGLHLGLLSLGSVRFSNIVFQGFITQNLPSSLYFLSYPLQHFLVMMSCYPYFILFRSYQSYSVVHPDVNDFKDDFFAPLRMKRGIQDMFRGFPLLVYYDMCSWAIPRFIYEVMYFFT